MLLGAPGFCYGVRGVRDFRLLDRFLDELLGDVYPEPVGEPHFSITSLVIVRLFEHGHLKAGDVLLDVGCRYGLALETFVEKGVDARGIALGEDVERCRKKGLDVTDADQSFMDFPMGISISSGAGTCCRT